MCRNRSEELVPKKPLEIYATGLDSVQVSLCVASRSPDLTFGLDGDVFVLGVGLSLP